MAGIEIGTKPAEVRRILGRPRAVLRRGNEFGPYSEYRYPSLLRVFFQGNTHVTAIDTRGRRERRAGESAWGRRGPSYAAACRDSGVSPDTATWGGSSPGDA